MHRQVLVAPLLCCSMRRRWDKSDHVEKKTCHVLHSAAVCHRLFSDPFQLMTQQRSETRFYVITI